MSGAEIFLVIIVFCLGLALGSFLNVLVYRLPLNKSIVYPPSSCPQCAKRLSALDLIPFFGYLLLGGRCRYCKEKISIRYPLVELSSGLLFIALYLSYGLTLDSIFYFTLLYILLAIALIDLEHRIVPNRLVAAGLITALLLMIPTLLASWLELPSPLILERQPLDALLGFLIGGTVLLIVFIVSRGGMGAGDVKLIAMIGFFVGLRGVAVVMMAAFLCGALVGIAYMLAGRLTRKDALPFAPYLAFGALVQVFWGEQIWNWYINLL